jgi:methionyl-tRNA synthetase
VNRLLVTNALVYANGPLHLGHLVEAVQTDIFVRAQRLLGRDVLFIGGDDTHGTPIELNAQKQGVSPEELIRRVYDDHVRDFASFGISYDEYGSTHTEENRRFAELFFQRLTERGHMVQRNLELTYCEVDKRFLPDRFVRGICPRCGSPDQYGDVCEVCKSTYSPIDLKDPHCAICGTVPVRRNSENFFVKLSDFTALLTDVAHGRARPHIDPQIQRFLQGWIAQGLQDWCISRDGPYFGFAIPGHAGKFFYVWLDAPIGYVSIAERHLQKQEKHAALYWDAQADSEIWHFIGKDIIYFHTLFWPAMLKGVGFKVPDRVVVHGMLAVKGEKMSKSRGRPLTARAYLESGLLPEQLRYYFAANLTPQPNDIDLNVEDFRHRVNAELVNNLANFCHRTLSLLRSRFEGVVGEPSGDEAATATLKQMHALVAPTLQAYRDVDLRQAVAQIVDMGNHGNLFLQQRKPWELGPRAHGDLSLCARGAFAIALLLKPVTPSMADAVLAQLGRTDATFAELEQPANSWRITTKLAEGPATLMPRIEPKQAQALLPAEEAALQSAAPAPAAGTVPKPHISFEDFEKLDLRCGLILAAEAVEGAKKLLKLTIDLGEPEHRTIASGIAESFRDPAKLVGRRVVIVANLEPRVIRGIRSAGMLLASGEGESVSLVELPASVRPGARVK